MINTFTEIEFTSLPNEKDIKILELNEDEIINVDSFVLNDYFVLVYTKKQSIELVSILLNPYKKELVKSKIIKECFTQNIINNVNIIINDKSKNVFEIIVFTSTFIVIINVNVNELKYSFKKSAEIQYNGILTCLCPINDNNYSFLLGFNNGSILNADIDITKPEQIELNSNKYEYSKEQNSILSYLNPFSYFSYSKTNPIEISGIKILRYIKEHDIICCIKDNMDIDIILMKKNKLILTNNYLKDKISQSTLYKLICDIQTYETSNDKTEINLLLVFAFNNSDKGNIFYLSFKLTQTQERTHKEYLYNSPIKDIMFHNNKLFISLINGDINVFDKNNMQNQLYIFTYEHKYMELQSKQTKDTSDIISYTYNFPEKSILNVMKSKCSKGFSNMSTVKNFISFSNSVNYDDIINNLISQEITENKIISFGILNTNTIVLIRKQTISILHEMDSNKDNLISCMLSRMKYYSHQLSKFFNNENKYLEQRIKSFIRKEIMLTTNKDYNFISIILVLMHIMFNYKENKNIFITDLEFVHEIINEHCSNNIDSIEDFLNEILLSFKQLFEENSNKQAQNYTNKIEKNNEYHELATYIKIVSKIINSHIEDLIMFTKSLCLLSKWIIEYLLSNNSLNEERIYLEESHKYLDICYRYYLTAKLISEKQYIQNILIENNSKEILTAYFNDNNGNIDYIIQQIGYSSNINIPLYKKLFMNKEYILISKCNSLINPKKNISHLNYFELIIQIINPKKVNTFRHLLTLLFYNLPDALDEDTPKQFQEDIINIQLINTEILGLNFAIQNNNIFAWIYKCINTYIIQTLNNEIKFHFYSFCFYYVLPSFIKDHDIESEIISCFFDFVFHSLPDKIPTFIENIKQLYPIHYKIIVNQTKQYILTGNNLKIKYKLIDSISLTSLNESHLKTREEKNPFLITLQEEIEQNGNLISNLDNLFLLKKIYFKTKNYQKLIELVLTIIQNYYNTIETLQKRLNELSDILYYISKDNIDKQLDINMHYSHIMCSIKLKILNNYENIVKSVGNDSNKYNSLESLKQNLINDNMVLNMIFEFEMYEFVIKYKLVYYLQEKVQKIFIINMIKNLSKNKERLLLLASFIQSIIENPYDENTNESKFILLETLLGMKVNLYKMKLCKLLVEKNDSRLFDLLQKYEDNESIQLLQNRQILSNYY